MPKKTFHGNAKARATVLRLYASGKIIPKITERTGVPASTISFWVRRSGLFEKRRSGWKLSEETREKMSLSRRGSLHHMWKGDALLRACSNCKTVFRRPHGRKEPQRGFTFCGKKCSHAFQIEERHPCWKGGRQECRGGRYVIWARAVLRRDHRACRMCWSRKLPHAHHIRPWAKFPKLRYEVKNGLTLCVRCHRKVHSLKLRPWVIYA